VKEKVVKENRGRPKKASVEIESNVPVDLFASIVNDVVEEVMEKIDQKGQQGDMVALVSGLETMSIVEKGKKETEKAEKEAKKETEKAEREAKKEAEKAEREAKKEAEKAKKEAEKVLKEAEKGQKKGKTSPKEPEEVVSKSLEKREEVVATERKSSPKVQVVRFEYNGVNYLKSLDTNILYDPDTKNEVGIWCEESKSIKELPSDEDEELEEEDYESD